MGRLVVQDVRPVSRRHNRDSFFSLAKKESYLGCAFFVCLAEAKTRRLKIWIRSQRVVASVFGFRGETEA